MKKSPKYRDSILPKNVLQNTKKESYSSNYIYEGQNQSAAVARWICELPSNFCWHPGSFLSPDRGYKAKNFWEMGSDKEGWWHLRLEKTFTLPQSKCVFNRNFSYNSCVSCKCRCHQIDRLEITVITRQCLWLLQFDLKGVFVDGSKGRCICTQRNNKLALKAYRSQKTHLGDVISNMNQITYSWIQQWGATETTTEISLITNGNVPWYQQKANHSPQKHKRWGGVILLSSYLKKGLDFNLFCIFFPCSQSTLWTFPKKLQEISVQNLKKMEQGQREINNVPERKTKGDGLTPQRLLILTLQQVHNLIVITQT